MQLYQLGKSDPRVPMELTEADLDLSQKWVLAAGLACLPAAAAR